MAAADTKKYDLVVFGATGFTGQFVVEEIAKTEQEEGGLKWAIAGRSMTKLQSVLKEASKYTGKDLEQIPIIIADVKSEDSLRDMCKSARAVLNCVGPYQFYGEPVVKACLENKAHHLDISGEPVFLEKMQLLYDKTARDNGVYILEACGFDSIPADLGVTYLRDNFKGDLNEVEAYLSINSGSAGSHGNIGTWSSAVHGFANVNKLKEIRKQLFPNPLPRSKFRMEKRPALFKNSKLGKWCLPFVGADRSIVMRSQRHNFEERKERLVQFNAYLMVPHFLAIFFLALLGLIFGIFSSFSFGRKLLEKYPKVLSLGLFDKTGPTRKQMAGVDFTMHLFGRGHSSKIEDPEQQHEDKPEQKMTVRVAGPELAYVTTPICMVQAAYTLLKEQDQLPASGGVYTPGAAFAKTTLVKRLKAHNMKFDIVDL